MERSFYDSMRTIFQSRETVDLIGGYFSNRTKVPAVSLTQHRFIYGLGSLGSGAVKRSLLGLTLRDQPNWTRNCTWPAKDLSISILRGALTVHYQPSLRARFLKRR